MYVWWRKGAAPCVFLAPGTLQLDLILDFWVPAYMEAPDWPLFTGVFAPIAPTHYFRQSVAFHSVYIRGMTLTCAALDVR